jgi:hypothetical protein
MAASSLRTAAAELPTFSIARVSSCWVTPKCLVQCLMPTSWSRTILLRSGFVTSITCLALSLGLALLFSGQRPPCDEVSRI